MRVCIRVVTFALLVNTMLVPIARAEFFQLCNASPVKITAAIGYKDEGAWRSRGWFNLDPGECAQPVNDYKKRRYYYVYGQEQGGSRTWRGSATFCVREPAAFNIVGDADCVERGFVPKGFLTVDVGTSTSYRQDLTCSDCSGSAPAVQAAPAPLAQVADLWEYGIGTYDDSWQTRTVVDTCDCEGPFGTSFECPCDPRVECQALRHEITVTVSGPNDSWVRDTVNQCANQAIQAGVLAGIVTAWSGGGAFSAAAEAAKDYFIACVGHRASTTVNVSVGDKSHWTDWGNCL